MLAIRFIGLFLAFSMAAQAEALLKNEATPQTKESMSEFLTQFISLKKFLVSDEEFQDPKNAAEISKHLKELSIAVKKTQHDPILNQENFKFSREVLQDHVSETERVFRLGNKSYARWMTNATLGICMSCHTQMPTQSRHFPVFLKADFFTSNFDQAEFMFATKDFEGASKIYKKIIKGFPKNNLSAEKLDKSIQREISYQIRIKRDLGAARAAIAEFRQQKQLPQDMLKNLASWDKQLKKWQTKKLPDVAKAQPQEIANFAQKNLSLETNQKRIEDADARFVTHLIVSGVLYEYLQKQPKSSSVPEVLYWLAVVDREKNNSLFYSLADLYLRECMLKFPESSTAIKCYKEYESEIVFGYTGSAGTNIPNEVKEDLKFLKSYVEAKGKIPLQRSAP